MHKTIKLKFLNVTITKTEPHVIHIVEILNYNLILPCIM